MCYKLESRQMGKISKPRICVWYMAENKEKLESILMRVKEDSEKASLKLNIIH